MRTWMLAIVMIVAPAIAAAEPQRIEDTKTPCESGKASGKQPCDAKPKSSKPGVPTPAERGSVIVPPDIPAEGLPNQDKEPSGSDGSPGPQERQR